MACESGGAVVAVAGVAVGEEAFDDDLDAGHAFGQRLDVLPQVRKVRTNFDPKTLDICAGLGP